MVKGLRRPFSTPPDTRRRATVAVHGRLVPPMAPCGAGRPQTVRRWLNQGGEDERKSSASGAGEQPFGDDSDRLALDLGLEAQQLERGGLVEPFALHDDATRLLDADVMLHREPQRTRKRLL